jgi:hypothetical protein
MEGIMGIGDRIKGVGDELLVLFTKEFGFKKVNEETGDFLKTYENIDYKYRGITLWIKEIVESIFAVFIIGFTFYLFYDSYYYFFVEQPDVDIVSKLLIRTKEILSFAGFFLAVDAVFLIAVLISSPGIDETIDSITVSIAAFLVLMLADLKPSASEESIAPSIVIVTLAFIIVLLIFSKHYLKERRNKNNFLAPNYRADSRPPATPPSNPDVVGQAAPAEPA